MEFSKVRMIFDNFRFIKYFSQNTMNSSLGRWQIKSTEQIEYYMSNMHADPGYQFLHTVERNKIFENLNKKTD